MTTEVTPDVESRILEAAKKVFAEKGFESTRMGDVATEAGISRTSLHYYFRTKEMLFDAIFARLMNTLIPNVSLILDEPVSFLEKLPMIVDQYITAVQQNPSLPLFVINELNRAPEHLYKAVLKEPVRLQTILRLRKQMTDEMEQGKLKKIPFIYTLTTLLGLVAFPMLTSRPLTDIFLDGDPAKFEAFIEERKSFVAGIMVNLLAPDKI